MNIYSVFGSLHAITAVLGLGPIVALAIIALQPNTVRFRPQCILQFLRIAGWSLGAVLLTTIPLTAGEVSNNKQKQPPEVTHNTQHESNMNTVRTRYMVNDIAEAVSFYTKLLGFQINRDFPQNPNFAMISRGDFVMVLSTPFGPGGAAKPMLDGRKAEPGGWNRIIINVDDLHAEIERLRKAHVCFRSDILTGPGGSEIILDDPSGNPVELFQPAQR